jgi:non-ribosomal peptide synthetase component E (peptide arylation enzyme)
VLQLSGGSTGVPKVIPRFHAEYLGHVKMWCDRYDTTSESKGIWALPLLHNAGMMFALLRTVIYGATMILVPRWDTSVFFRLANKWDVQHAFTIGPHVSAISTFVSELDKPQISLQFFFTLQGAESIERATNVPATNMFGITEGLVLTSAPRDRAELRHGTIGYVCSPFDEVRIKAPDSDRDVELGETGELCFRGPSSLRGYYRAPEINRISFTDDGFFRTADLVRAIPLDGRMAYRFEGRMRDNINRGGEKFGTEDIEQMLARHPAIADGKIVAMPDPTYGEKACAFLIPVPGRAVPSVAELGSFLTEQGLAKFKLPERIEVVEAFPVTRVGKLDRAKLREAISLKLAAEKNHASV